ncbi:MAG TPA: putative LPS assembly protein LptD [Salinivirgaceae bacterium]|nr:putative LPS assembly protein LptD [Salinivirgaceae bacterium]
MIRYFFRYTFLIIALACTATIQAQNRGIDDKGTTKASSILGSTIFYSAEDSIIAKIKDKKEVLIGNAKIRYQNIELSAAYIEIDFAKNEVFAKGLPDSTGNISGFPNFKEGTDAFEATTIRYNFNTKKGLIQDVVTEQDGGFLHSNVTKKHTKNIIDLKGGKYTTCDHEHPHFYIYLSKARVIQNEKIVAGPAYLVIADVPTPIAIPFGYFPFTKERASGIIIPGYGESRERGFYLTNGGYYWAGTEYFDFRIIGSIYTKGSWDIDMRTRYKVRYKYSGQIGYRHEKIVVGERDAADYNVTTAYALTWQHQQDPKAHPYRRFGANVNLRSSASNRYSTNLTNYVQNTVTSDISYQHSLPGTPFSLAANLRHSLNTLDSTVNLSLPTASLNMRKINPFERKNKTGATRWYETIGISYNSSLQNSAKMKERDFLTNRMYEKFQYGINHNINTSGAIKFLKYLNFSPQASYKERWYFSKIQRNYLPGYAADTNAVDPPIRDTVTIDTMKGFYRVWDYNVGAGVNTTFYGLITFNPNLPIQAVRLVHQPSISFTYKPDFGNPKYGYYHVDTIPKLNYNHFANGIFGTPPIGESKSIGFSLSNNIEMKVRSHKKDSTPTTKKITLLDALNFSTSYNAASDSLNWSPLTINARTKLFNAIIINFGSSMDWYALNPISGQRINKFVFDLEQKLGRLTTANLTIGFNLNSNSLYGTTINPNLTSDDENYYYNYFNIPWSMAVNYSYSYSKYTTVKRVIQTINLSGDFSVTPKWKISYSTGYDIEKRSISLTNFGITRDLHCWAMRFEWVPFGERQSYFFTIGVKSSILKDLKYDKREFYFDTVK